MPKIIATRMFEVYSAAGKRPELFTKSLTPGKRVYGERLVQQDGEEFRSWDPTRSKLAAFIMNGAQNVGLRKGDAVLYLGASSGTTVSHVSDVVGKDGVVFALDFAPRVVRDLWFVSRDRENLIPLLEDAFHPETYAHRITGVDVVYQDIAQRNQVEIFVKNVQLFLKPKGYGLLAIKARSVDVTKKPKDIFRQVHRELEAAKLTVADYRPLEPFEKDHAMFLVRN